jgi:Lysyl oxidase
MRVRWFSIGVVAMGAACSEPTAAPADGGSDLGSVDVPKESDAGDRCDPRRRLDDGGTAFSIADGCALPNLTARISRVQIQTRVFTAGSCEVAEGCTLPGRRRLLRFDLTTPNLGRGDLFLGPPLRDNRPTGPFEFSACHGHYHFLGYADYRLCSGANCEVARGHKQSFCLEDYGPFAEDNHVPVREWYRCDNQGIHAGSFDLYTRDLDCQYIDVTDTPPGRYRIRVQINTERHLAESDYSDNEAFLDVEIPATDPVSTEVNPTDVCPTGISGTTRDCGWNVDRTTNCTAGEMITLGCNAACSPSLGDCVGNPILRVCAGDGPCTHQYAVAELADACGASCRSLTFRCPASPSRFTVLTSGMRAGEPYTCHMAVAGR